MIGHVRSRNRARIRCSRMALRGQELSSSLLTYNKCFRRRSRSDCLGLWRRLLGMASWKSLAPGLTLASISAVLLITAMITDYWYVFDASEYQDVCPEENIFDPINKGIVYSVGNGLAAVSQHDMFVPAVVRHRHNNIFSTVSLSPKHMKPTPLRGYATGSTFNAVALSEARSSEVDLRKSKALDEHFYRYSRPFRKLKKRRSAETRMFTFPINERRLQKWRKLQNDLLVNLYSFGGRDITAMRQIRIDEESRHLSATNKTPSTVEVTKPSCIHRQFSTTTGLWRTCYVPGANSILAQLIACGNLTRCAPISYNGVVRRSFPASLRGNETSMFYQDERMILNVRRTVTSFLFLSLVMQLFGSLVTSIGWYQDCTFKQKAGGLVLLMASVFLLSGMCTYVILCHLEMSRQPSQVYGTPTCVFHGYGASTFAAWTSFGTTLVASLLCVIASMKSSRDKPTEILRSDHNVVISNADVGELLTAKFRSATYGSLTTRQSVASSSCRRDESLSNEPSISSSESMLRIKVRKQDVDHQPKHCIEPWDSPSHSQASSTVFARSMTRTAGAIGSGTLPKMHNAGYVRNALKRQKSHVEDSGGSAKQYFDCRETNPRKLAGFNRRTRSLGRDPGSNPVLYRNQNYSTFAVRFSEDFSNDTELSLQGDGKSDSGTTLQQLVESLARVQSAADVRDKLKLDNTFSSRTTLRRQRSVDTENCTLTTPLCKQTSFSKPTA